MSIQPTNSESRVGRYRLVERLAVGGMAEVFLAIEADQGIERLVVIKSVLPQHDEDDAFTEMFLHEARIAARVQHPNVVQLYELGEHDGQPFIAMEYVPGVSLLELMTQAQKAGVGFPAGVAIQLVVQACSGAHAAHEVKGLDGRPSNLVHRDLSPHNLMVTADGHVKILDFGIAKAEDIQERTRAGVIKGKFPYMSPEQVREEPLDRQSDVFTLGIVLFELLSGEKLFLRGNQVATMAAVLKNEVPDLARKRPNLPRGLLDEVSRALSTDKQQRHPSAEALRRSLSEAAAAAGLDMKLDSAAAFVDTLVGTRLHSRADAVDEAVARVLDGPTEMVARPGAGTTSRRWWPWALALVALTAASAGALLLSAGAAWWVQSRPTVHGDVVEIGLPPTIDPDILERDLEVVRVFLEREVGRPFQWRLAEDYEGVAQMLSAGEVPFAFMPPYLYIKSRGADPSLWALVIKKYDGSDGTDGVLLVREDSDIQSVGDLRGRRICYSDLTSTTGYLLPRAFLRANDVDPETDLKDKRISGNHLQVLRDLNADLCDVGGTFTGAYSSAEKVGVSVARIRILAVTGRSPHEALVVGNADGELTAAVRKALLSFRPEDAGDGAVERVSGFFPATDKQYEALHLAVQAESASQR